jgi:hypothetical protein
MSVTRNIGMVFENAVHRQLLKTRRTVYRENDIMRSYGRHITAIDHMLDFDNCTICIQDKFQQSAISIDKTCHFIQNVNMLSHIINKKCIGIYLTRSLLSKPSQDAFNFENLKNLNEFVTIYGQTQGDLIKNLSKYFYQNGIYMYDSDGDTIML